MAVPTMDIDPKGVDQDVEMEMSDSPPSAKKAKKAAPKKKKKAVLGLTFPMQPKNPVALLNELRQNLTFDLVSQTGPVHAPVFTMKVIVSVIPFFRLPLLLLLPGHRTHPPSSAPHLAN